MSRPFSEIRRPMTPERRERIDAIKRSMEEAEGCHFCHRTAPIVVGTYTRMDFGRGGIVLCCDDCREKGDDVREDLENWDDQS